MEPFEVELRQLLNSCCKENESNTPDFILAKFMLGCLDVFNRTIKERDEWHEFDPNHILHIIE